MDLDTTPLTDTAAVSAAPSLSHGWLPWKSLVDLGRARADTLGDQPLYTFLPERAGGGGPPPPPRPPQPLYTSLPERAGEDAAHLTYAGLDLRARAIAAALQRLGAGGQRALLLYPPGPELGGVLL